MKNIDINLFFVLWLGASCFTSVIRIPFPYDVLAGASIAAVLTYLDYRKKLRNESSC